MKYLVTGGAGFIGSSLVHKLVSQGHEVCVIDNLSSGFSRHLAELPIQFVKADLTDSEIVANSVFKNSEKIFHLAANVDNRFSWQNPFLGIQSNIVATMNIGLACRKWEIPEVVYASTGTIYGDCSTPPFLEQEESSAQTSLYGATKYSAEGILSCFSNHFDINVLALRFVGVLGERVSHGHIFDFVRSIRTNPTFLNVLGDGNQKKSYMYVGDLVEALAGYSVPKGFTALNIGRDDYSIVKDSVRWIKEALEIDFKEHYGVGNRGWIGDNPFLQLDTTRVKAMGWQPTTTIEDSAKISIRWLWENQWIFDSVSENR